MLSQARERFSHTFTDLNMIANSSTYVQFKYLSRGKPAPEKLPIFFHITETMVITHIHRAGVSQSLGLVSIKQIFNQWLSLALSVHTVSVGILGVLQTTFFKILVLHYTSVTGLLSRPTCSLQFEKLRMFPVKVIRGSGI